MGMFDREVQLKNAEDFNPQQPFELFEAEFLGMSKSAQYGSNPKARVKAGPAGSVPGAAKEYVVFGVMAEQVGRMDNSDLPATVKIGQDGQANVFVRA